MRTILRHCEKTTDPGAPDTLPVSFNEIHSQLPKDKTMTRHTLEQWLKLMTESMPEFISKVDESGGGTYTINTFRALQALCTAHVESVVEERLGSKAKRIFQVIIQNKHLEQDTIERCVLMPAKQSRALVYRMFKEHFIRVSELSKTPDHVASRTFYLMSVDLKQIARLLLDNGYQSLKNLLLSRQHTLSDAKRLLEKQERVEAIIMSLGLPASYAHGDDGDREGVEVDEVKKEQVDAILETITPAEKQHLKKVKALTQHLELAEQSLISSTILTLESYLAMTYHPPPVKPTKSLLD
ncbi:DNA-directed RNA polymerase III subunit RPC3-like [Babylonia areolata]|uniref:DNA-directed RNA polymerase III subunit RPC3-like n=1 Tax=Babylonia areolata TaxID=304850 RepID=UPI003FD2A0C2